MNNLVSDNLIPTELADEMREYLFTNMQFKKVLVFSHQSTDVLRHMRTGESSNTWAQYHVGLHKLFPDWKDFPFETFDKIKQNIIEQFKLTDILASPLDPLFGDMISVGTGAYSCHVHTDGNITFGDEEWIHTRLNVLIRKPRVGGEQLVWTGVDTFPEPSSPTVFEVTQDQPWIMVAGLMPHGTAPIPMGMNLNETTRCILSYGTLIRREDLLANGYITDNPFPFDTEHKITSITPQGLVNLDIESIMNKGANYSEEEDLTSLYQTIESMKNIDNNQKYIKEYIKQFEPIITNFNHEHKRKNKEKEYNVEKG